MSPPPYCDVPLNHWPSPIVHRSSPTDGCDDLMALPAHPLMVASAVGSNSCESCRGGGSQEARSGQRLVRVTRPDGFTPRKGPVTGNAMPRFRSFAAEPMRHGNQLLLADDAARRPAHRRRAQSSTYCNGTASHRWLDRVPELAEQRRRLCYRSGRRLGVSRQIRHPQPLARHNT